MDTTIDLDPIKTAPTKSRVYYLDWLRVLAILMVFLFHGVHVFDFGSWQIKNAEQSEMITILLTLLSMWGMPFFFLIAGTASWFALQQRTTHKYISERFNRLLIPFLIGSLIFSPIQYYLEWMNRTHLGIVSVSFLEFIREEMPPFNPLLLRFPGFSPKWFGVFGFHLWFVGYLFAFALVTIPLFRWFKGETGTRFISRLSRICVHRGGILIFILPLLVVQFVLRPFFQLELDWADFIFRMSFFVQGYLLFADERITRAVRRDWWLSLALGTIIIVALLGMYIAGLPVMTWGQDPSYPQYYLILALTTTIALCYTLTMLFVGMRFLDFTNKWLRYGQEAALPFFVLHQPAIVIIAFFVVQWNASIYVKLPIVVLSSFVASIGFYDLIIRRIHPLRLMFGMKSQLPDKTQAGTKQVPEG
jgi:peptidoglycan/LPS O-acetylase OafA/YrhL